MVHLFTAVAHAATDTVNASKVFVPALTKELAPLVLEKLSPEEMYRLFVQALRPTQPMTKFIDNLPVLFFLLVVGFAIWLFVKLRSKRNTERHEEVLAMIEKGIYEPPPVQEPEYWKELYLFGITLLVTGIILSATGLAFLLYTLTFGKSEFFLAGLLCLLTGLSLMGSYRFLAKKAQREESNNALQENPPA